MLPSPLILLSHIKILILFYIFAFLLHIRITILLLLQYIIWFFTPTLIFFLLDYVLFYCTLSDILLPISVSPPFNFPLLCLSIAYTYNLSLLILQSHHFILSLLSSKYSLLTTIPDKGLSPKRRIIKFFFKFTYLHLDHYFRRFLYSNEECLERSKMSCWTALHVSWKWNYGGLKFMLEEAFCVLHMRNELFPIFDRLYFQTVEGGIRG